MLPEHSSRIEEIESTITWMKLLAPHTPVDQKSLVMEMHSLGIMSDDVVSALFSLLRLGAV